MISRGLSRRLHCHMRTPPFGKGFYRINSASALSHSNRGYSLFSFMRASAVVNCQSALV